MSEQLKAALVLASTLSSAVAGSSGCTHGVQAPWQPWLEPHTFDCCTLCGTAATGSLLLACMMPPCNTSVQPSILHFIKPTLPAARLPDPGLHSGANHARFLHPLNIEMTRI
jgi:hypothetical protein